MEQLGAPRWNTIAVAAWLGLVAAGVTFVLPLRADNPGPEPQGQNWWLVCWLVMAAVYGGTGVALLGWRPRRRLAVGFLIIGACALLNAVAVQYRGYVSANGGRPPWPRLADADDWSRPVLAGVLAVFVPWELLAPTGRRGTAANALRLVGLVAVAVLAATAVLGRPEALERVAAWTIVAVATAGTVALAVRWWRNDRRSDDLLPAWLLVGVIAAWLAVVPDLSDLADWRLAGRDVVAPMLFMATVPLLVAGTIIELLRRAPSGRTVHRVVEWTMLAGGIVVVYTALVAGLGQLVGGSGPTWFLVASTGIIALALEPVHATDRSQAILLARRGGLGARNGEVGSVERGGDGDGPGAVVGHAARGVERLAQDGD